MSRQLGGGGRVLGHRGPLWKKDGTAQKGAGKEKFCGVGSDLALFLPTSSVLPVLPILNPASARDSFLGRFEGHSRCQNESQVRSEAVSKLEIDPRTECMSMEG